MLYTNLIIERSSFTLEYIQYINFVDFKILFNFKFRSLSLSQAVLDFTH